MATKRYVVDTGVIVSAMLWNGFPARAFERVADTGILIFTEATLQELARVLAYEKFDAMLNLEARREVVHEISRNAEFVVVTEPIVACEDPNDDIILEAAVYGRADAIIASDKKLTKMNPFRGIPILTPSQFLEN